MKWIALHDKSALKPMPGEWCLISFEAAREHVVACYFDNRKSFDERIEAEGGEPIEFELNAGFKRGWFTDCYNQEDWWEPKYVAYWSPLVLPPAVEAQKREQVK